MSNAKRLAEHVKGIPPVYVRNGYRFNILSCRDDGNMLRLQVQVRQGSGANGPIVIDPETDPHFNELIIVNPRINSNGQGQDDLLGTIRIELDRLLARKVNA